MNIFLLIKTLIVDQEKKSDNKKYRYAIGVSQEKKCAQICGLPLHIESSIEV